MNIFPIEGDIQTGKIDWEKSAKSHDNLRLVKQTLESCQLLSTAVNVNGGKAPYKSFNPKHPSCLWVSESSQNYRILHDFTGYLLDEYYVRFKKLHKCWNVRMQCFEEFKKIEQNFKLQEETPLRMAMPKEFMIQGNPVLSYRNYWITKEKMRYPEDKIPDWFKQSRTLPYDIIKRGK